MRVPTITLAGRDWPIPPLAPRQNRIVLPALLDGTLDYGRLADCVFAAISRAHPAILREEFEQWPLPLCEMLAALPVIAEQTGFMERRKRSACSSPPGLPDWDAIIAQVCNFRPGTTEEYYEDNLTAPRLAALREEWRKHPPLTVLVSAWLGYRPRQGEEDAIAELLRLFPTGVIRAGTTP